ncbi:MAG TPA: CRTAC1 family protein, partial [Opitutaceae bacterium]
WMGTEGHYPCSLLRNNGDFTFTDVTEEAGLLRFHPTGTAVWFDYNNDGWVDLFIANESREGDRNACELYRNNGDGTFTECAAENGLDLVGFFKGVVSADFNNDGRPDLYLSRLDGPKLLMRNDGPAGADASARAKWKFTDVAEAAGVTEPPSTFACWFFDYNNDGWPDIFVAGYAIEDVGDVAADYLGLPYSGQRAKVYCNNKDGTFTDVTRELGLDKLLPGMGANFGDLDNDGWLDFYVGTGNPDLSSLMPNRMFRNDEGNRFLDVTTSGGFGQLQKGHGIAFGDINNSGTQDIYSVVGGAVEGDAYHRQLFANPGHGNNWIKLRLEGVRTNRAAIGARIRVVVPTGLSERSIHRTVGSGAHFGSSTLRQEIGLGPATTIKRVEILWPVTGETQLLEDLEINTCYHVREGSEPEKVALGSFKWPAASGA